MTIDDICRLERKRDSLFLFLFLVLLPIILVEANGIGARNILPFRLELAEDLGRALKVKRL